MSRYVVHPAKQQVADPRYINQDAFSGLGEMSTDVKIPAWMVIAGIGGWALFTESGKKTVKKLKEL